MSWTLAQESMPIALRGNLGASALTAETRMALTPAFHIGCGSPGELDFPCSSSLLSLWTLSLSLPVSWLVQFLQVSAQALVVAVTLCRIASTCGP